MSKKLLVYGQDVGSVRVMLPVVKQLVTDRRFDVTVMGSGTAAEVFRHGGVSSLVLRNGNSLPLTDAAARRLIQSYSPDAMLCGASHLRDPTNARLINACRMLGIRTLALLDHWKNLERFTPSSSVKDSPALDLLGVMDTPVKEALVRLGLKRDRIFVVGHPYLEEIYRKRRTLLSRMHTSAVRRRIGIEPNEILVLCCSEMLHAHGVSQACQPGCTSLFEVRVHGASLLAQVTEAARRVSEVTGRHCRVVLRPHPFEREHRRPLRRPGVDLMDHAVCSDIEAVATADVVIGISAMPMIQAYVLGKPVVSVAFPVVRKRQGDYAQRFLWKSGETFSVVRSCDALRCLLEAVACGRWQHSGLTPQVRLVLRDATGRAVRLLERALRENTSRTRGMDAVHDHQSVPVRRAHRPRCAPTQVMV